MDRADGNAAVLVTSKVTRTRGGSALRISQPTWSARPLPGMPMMASISGSASLAFREI